MKRFGVPLLWLAVFAALVAVAGPVGIALRERDTAAALPDGVPGRMLDVGGRRVHVVEAGAGAPLVLVHGFGSSTHDFEELVLAPLAASHRVIALDLYGYGWSERSDAFHYGWSLWAEQLAGTLDALGIERASVLGHSMGGAVAAVFAARHPDRVDRLILADAFYPPEPGGVPLPFRVLKAPVLGELVLASLADASAPGFSDAHHERALAWYRIPGTRHGMLEYVRDPAKLPELTAAYPAIAAPTLLLHGTADAFVSYTAMERAAPAIRNARIVSLTGGTHFPFRDAPDDFVREVLGFLAPP